MYMSTMRKNYPLTLTKLAGYQVCIIRLERGTKIQTISLEIRADMFSCHNAKITRLDISLTIPTKLLLKKIPAIDNLPHMATIAQARQQFNKGILSFDKLDELAKSILRDKQTVRTSRSNKFTQDHTWKMSIIFGIVSFILSMVLHFSLAT